MRLSARDASGIRDATMRGVPFTAGHMHGGPGAALDLGRMDPATQTAYRAARDHITYTIRSYETPIAWQLDSGEWVAPDSTYSATTARHCATIRAALSPRTLYDTRDVRLRAVARARTVTIALNRGDAVIVRRDGTTEVFRILPATLIETVGRLRTVGHSARVDDMREALAAAASSDFDLMAFIHPHSGKRVVANLRGGARLR